VRRWLLVLVLAALSACSLSSGAPKERLKAGDSGVIRFRVNRVTTLSGALAIPPGPGPFPAVVLLHGCDGLPSGVISGWRTALQQQGYATLEVDSFGGRKLTTVCDNPPALWFAERVPDAYAALELLATHPRIAADRIVLMGWSDGGSATIHAAAASVARRFTRPSGPRFKAFFAFYPRCDVFFEDGRASQPVRASMERLIAPVRIHSGALDDLTPPGPCEVLVKALRESGNDIDITVYGGALHAFDRVSSAPAAPTVAKAGGDKAAAESSRAARDKPAVESSRPLTLLQRERGVWNPKATEQARRAVQEQLAALMRGARTRDPGAEGATARTPR
jgi:dienelactone hydrolase